MGLRMCVISSLLSTEIGDWNGFFQDVHRRREELEAQLNREHH
jgi:hypothetical protein